MIDSKQTVKDYYNMMSETEWNRIDGRPEFYLTCRFIDRYVKKGDKILDVGGGPGRYSLYLADKGCDVTLFDLAEENLKLAKQRADEQGLQITTVCGDACNADELLNDQFDHVLLMGPMYHLLEEADRMRAINASLNLLKPSGVLYVSFISMVAGMIYAMKFAPEIIASTVLSEIEYMENFMIKKSFAGDAFTKAFFIDQDEILPFMEHFPLEMLHFFGQEGITSPCEKNIMSQPKEIINLWLDLSEKVCERDEFLSFSEHLMYIGRKKV